MNTFRLVVSLAVFSILFNSCKKDNKQPQAPANVITNVILKSIRFRCGFQPFLKIQKRTRIATPLIIPLKLLHRLLIRLRSVAMP
jgi:ribonucleotide reductase beta subunit family protein with ferritin-like domain